MKLEKLLQVRPPLQEQTVEVHHQIQQLTHTPPPSEELLIQMRPQLYLPTQELTLLLVLCPDHATEEATERKDRHQKFINQDLEFLNKKKENRLS